MSKEELDRLSMMEKLDWAVAATSSTDLIFRGLVDKGFAFERKRDDGGFDWGITDAGRAALQPS